MTIAQLQETARQLRLVLNRICDLTGHPRLAPGESADSVAESVAVVARYRDELQERLDSISPDWLARFAASEEHHQEHHRNEEGLAAEIERLRAEVERLRVNDGRPHHGDGSDLPARLAVAIETCRRYEEWALADLLDEARGRLASAGV